MLQNFMDAHLGLWGKCCTHQFLCRSRPRKMALSTKSSSGRRWERGCLWFGMQSGDGETKHESCWAWKPNPEVSQKGWANQPSHFSSCICVASSPASDCLLGHALVAHGGFRTHPLQPGFAAASYVPGGKVPSEGEWGWYGMVILPGWMEAWAKKVHFTSTICHYHEQCLDMHRKCTTGCDFGLRGGKTLSL